MHKLGSRSGQDRTSFWQPNLVVWESGGGHRKQLRLIMWQGRNLWREAWRGYWGKWIPVTAKVQHFEDASTIGWSQRTAAVVEWSQLESRRQAVCAAEGRSDKQFQRSQIIRHWIIYTFEIWFCFVHIVIVPWFIPLEVRQYLISFVFTGAQSWNVEFQKPLDLTASPLSEGDVSTQGFSV